MAPTPSAQRLRRGLPGYLILFAPHAFAPQRQYRPRAPPSPPVFLLISAHFTATPGIPCSPVGLEPQQYRLASPSRARSFHSRLAEPPTSSLRPINPDNARPLRITAAAGT